MKKKFILLPITLTALTPMVSMVGCGNHDDPTPTPDPEPVADITIDLTEEISKEEDRPEIESIPFTIDTSKVYMFKVNASICTHATCWDGNVGTFLVYQGGGAYLRTINANVSKFVVRGKEFQKEDSYESFDEGKYFWDGTLGWLYKDFEKVDKTFNMFIVCQFLDHNQESAIASWGSDT